jgi:hypothetical protein
MHNFYKLMDQRECTIKYKFEKNMKLAELYVKSIYLCVKWAEKKM